MISKREEERNEKIIRGLMKLPPNRRCINCNSLGPQYVCTNFWTFVCVTCSGIHREFTHRVKSVSMAKFTSQEVDALQRGGNQRTRELFLQAWDQQSQRFPDNSNVDEVREFIKSVYVDKKYSLEKLSDRPPTDPQILRSQEDETRRASSYDPNSQSPSFDFQHEERHYGKHTPALTRKPGSDRGLYEGKLSSFLSPSHFSDHANNDMSATEGSNPGVSDYSVPSGGDPFRPDILSPSSRRDNISPFSETSRDISVEVPGRSEANSRSSGERILHPQRTASSGSFGSLDGNSIYLESVNSMGLHEVASKTEQSAEISHKKSSSTPSPLQSSVSETFNGLDLFSAPFAPQIVPTFSEQQPSQIQQPSSLHLFAALSHKQSDASSNGNTSDVETKNNGGWWTFDMPLNVVPMGTENSAPAAVLSSDGNILGNFNPFSLDQSSFSQDSASHEFAVLTRTFCEEGMDNSKASTNNFHFWNAFEDSAGQQPMQNVLKNSGQAAEHCASDADKFPGIVVFEAGVHSISADRKHTNPFDLPYDSDREATNVPLFWDTSSLEDALPNNQAPVSYVGVNHSWFSQNSVPSYVPGGVIFDPPSGLLGFIAPNTHMLNAPAQVPVAFVGGNPFA